MQTCHTQARHGRDGDAGHLVPEARIHKHNVRRRTSCIFSEQAGQLWLEARFSKRRNAKGCISLVFQSSEYIDAIELPIA